MSGLIILLIYYVRFDNTIKKFSVFLIFLLHLKKINLTYSRARASIQVESIYHSKTQAFHQVSITMVAYQ